MSRPLIWLALLSLPFFLNDLFFWWAEGYLAWLGFDYLFKAIALLLVWVWVQRGGSWAQLGLVRLPWRPLLFWTVGLSLLGVAIDQSVPGWMMAAGYDWRLFGFPAIDSSAVLAFDLSFGLALTAVSEEVVFRGFAILALLPFIRRPVVLVLGSSLLFGAVHWGLGPAVILTAALWGIVPAVSVVVTRSIYPAIIAHYVTNFVDFSGWFF